MIKLERTDNDSWKECIRKLYNGKGVRFVSPGSYEAYISIHGKFLSCGTHPTEQQAQEAVIATKIKLFEDSVITNGDNPIEIVESVEKGYFVSPRGNVYNRHGEIMEGAIDRFGYRHIIINKKNKNIHRIIAETFIPNPNNLPCINHKDGNKLNNEVWNLEWCTHSYNTIHAYQNCLEQKQCGEQNHAHKLTEEDVKYIRQVYVKRDKKFGAVALAARFNVDRTTIHDIVRCKTWRDLL